MGTFRGEIASGDLRRSLVALRDALAEAIEEQLKSMSAKSGLCRKCGGDASAGSGIAAMAMRLRQVLSDLEALPQEKEKTALDEISERRKRRRAAAAANFAQPEESRPVP